MTNYERYKDWFEDHKMELLCGRGFGVMNGEPFVCVDSSSCLAGCEFLKSISCCPTQRKDWMYTVNNKPTVDWDRVPVDTKVEVRDREDEPWIKGHFAGWDNHHIYIWKDGATSFTVPETVTRLPNGGIIYFPIPNTTIHNYGRLYNIEDARKYQFDIR